MISLVEAGKLTTVEETVQILVGQVGEVGYVHVGTIGAGIQALGLVQIRSGLVEKDGDALVVHVSVPVGRLVHLSRQKGLVGENFVVFFVETIITERTAFEEPEIYGLLFVKCKRE